ncbi:MAG TPA: fatty acid desaturase [Pirellulales bacterium]|nr:fatty acid desaturase [Pirellulales bacterium]
MISDLFEPRVAIYWTDFLLSMAVGVGGLAALRRLPLTWAGWIAIYTVAVLAFYRAAMFSHEVVHLRGDKFKAFRAAWNLLCGIPFLIPSFLYQTHTLHHVRKHYGTAADGEYLPLATGPVRNIFLFLCEPLVMPAIAVVRFLVLAPLTWISPRSRNWVYSHASAMVIDPSFVRPLPARGELRLWRLQEAACFAVAAGTAVAVLSGLRPWQMVRDMYLIAAGVLMLNAIRTLGAHRYLHRGEEVSFVEQLLDSLNYPFHPISGELWAPVGLRFHALHHLFPSLPYHALPTAHKRLMEGLPDNSPYRRTISKSLPSALLALWRRARRAS